jgi:hypothetical protein
MARLAIDRTAIQPRPIEAEAIAGGDNASEHTETRAVDRCRQQGAHTWRRTKVFRNRSFAEHFS